MGRIAQYETHNVSTVVGEPIKDSKSDTLRAISENSSASLRTAASLYESADQEFFAPEREAQATNAAMDYTQEAMRKTAALQASNSDNPSAYTASLRESLTSLQTSYAQQIPNEQVRKLFTSKTTNLNNTLHTQGTAWAIDKERENGVTAVKLSLLKQIESASMDVNYDNYKANIDNSDSVYTTASQFISPDELTPLVATARQGMTEGYLTNLISEDPFKAVSYLQPETATKAFGATLPEDKRKELFDKAIKSDELQKYKYTEAQWSNMSESNIQIASELNAGNIAFKDISNFKTQIAMSPDYDPEAKKEQLAFLESLTNRYLSTQLETNLDPIVANTLAQRASDIQAQFNFIPSFIAGHKKSTADTFRSNPTKALKEIAILQRDVEDAFAQGSLTKTEHRNLQERVIPMVYAAIKKNKGNTDATQLYGMSKALVSQYNAQQPQTTSETAAMETTLFLKSVEYYDNMSRLVQADSTALGDNDLTKQDLVASAVKKAQYDYLSDKYAPLLKGVTVGEVLAVPIVDKKGRTSSLSGTFKGFSSTGFPLIDLDTQSEKKMKL